MSTRRKPKSCRPSRTISLVYSRAVVFLLISALAMLCVPPAMAAPVTRHGISRASNQITLAARRLELNAVDVLLSIPKRGPIGFLLSGWALSFKEPVAPSQRPNENRGVRSRHETRNEKQTRVAALQVNPSGQVRLQSQQQTVFTAIPTDAEGNSIHGLHATWVSTDDQVLTIKPDGRAIAGKRGRATLTATAGPLTATVDVVVVENNGRGKKVNSSRRSQPVAQNLDKNPSDKRTGNSTLRSASQSKAGSRSKLKHHDLSAGSAMAPVPQRPPNEDPLPDDETFSLYEPGNLVGSPPGKRKGGAAPSPVPKLLGFENGSQNFNFGLPIVGLAGRGLDVSLALVYNSQLWNKSIDPGDSSTWMTYDVDSGWPSAGFRLGFGQIEDQGGSGFTLTDPDGTRHALVYSSTNSYVTNDGTFINYFADPYGPGILRYPDGTMVVYGAAGGGLRTYPTQIIDRNGNYILISYAGTNGAGPKISSIQDTLSRYINFYYASNGDLVTITAPGLGTSDLQVMRFYYTDVTLGSSLFDSGINVSAPTSAHTLQYVYLPTSSDGTNPHIGYKFEYSSYGMVREITQFRGMTVSSSSTSSAGSITGDGTLAAQTTYGYPTSGQSLTDVPKYSTRTDEWAGRTTSGSAPYYSFANSSTTGEKISTVTAPDNTVSETHTIDNPNNWDNGLVKQTLIKYGSTVLSNTVIDWEQTPSSGPPRVHAVRVTDEGSTARTRATVFDYTSYNNVSEVSARDFTTDGSISSTELRRTETTYINSSGYTDRRLLQLPETVQVFPGGSNTPVSRVDYAYDNYGTSYANMTARDDIIMYEPQWDPFGGTFVSALGYRGNVTSVKTYPDATTTSGAITHTTTYDIAGNVTTAQVDCCQLKSFTYSGAGEEGDYAYVISVTSGDPGGLHLTTSATYDYNTGLVDTTTDENSQTSTNYYNSDSLRLDHTTYPDGGATYLTYWDALTYGRYNVGVSTKLDNNGSGGAARYVNSYYHYDGRGGLARSFTNPTAADGWVTQDIQYDEMGRAYRASNPYYSTGVDASVNPDGYWTTSTFDHLGRTTQVLMPRGDNDNSLTTNVQTSFDGIFTTVTDQAGKVRRQRVDALGRLTRLDEPTTSGLGAVSSPNQATDYYYDTLDNLVRINQGSQNRYFKYDSLSRLIRERQVEQDTNSTYDLSDSITGNSSWSRKLVYNSSSLVTDAYDARGVQATFSYDDLNRVTSINYSDSTPDAFYYYDSQSLPSGAPSYTHSNTTGRLLAMTYGSSTSITGNYFAYDVTGRVTTQRQVTGSTVFALSYTYNYAGMLTSETYPSSRALSYSYDEGGRLSAMGDGTTTFASSFQYAGHGGLKSETFGNGMVHALEYNRRLQASRVKLSQTVSSVTTVLQQYDYGYGEFNTSSGVVDTSKNNGQIGKIDATIGTTAQWNQGYSYDELGRLSNVVEHSASAMTTTNYSQSYTYDRYGNRFQSANTTLGLPAVSSSEINAATNRFITTGSTPTTYDAAGNTNDTKFRNLKYEYDANGRQTAAKLQNDTTIQSSVYDCAGQRVQTTAGSVTRTMVYDVFGQDVADYLGSSGSTLERENIYRGGQLLATDEHLNAAAPSALASTPSSSNVALSWTAASGASKYRVERKSASGSYGLLTTTTSTSYTDSGATSGNAYLYRVCAADNANNCTSDYSNIVLGARLNFSTDSTITGYSENPSSATSIKAAHITELRTAIDAVRSLAGQSAASYTHSSLAAGDVVYADDVRELRTKLAEALSALAIQSSTYTDSTIVSFAENPLTATSIKAVHIRELRVCATSGAGTSTSGGSSGGLHYFLTDIQGSTRMVINNNGTSSAIIARHDYLPFGEEIGAGIGTRSGSQGYAATDTNRRKYALLERDDATGLDHTWWRKYENLSGRWTSPDPLDGSIGDPQSFNGYPFVQNDPVNFVDPSGLCGYTIVWIVNADGSRTMVGTVSTPCVVNVYAGETGISSSLGGAGTRPLIEDVAGETFGEGSGGGLGGNPLTPAPRGPTPAQRRAYADCIKTVSEIFTQAQLSIPNVFHNSRPTWPQVKAVAYGSGFRGLVSGVIFGPLSGVKTAGESFVQGVALAWSYNVTSNFVSNAVQRGRLIGEEIKARLACRALLQ